MAAVFLGAVIGAGAAWGVWRLVEERRQPRVDSTLQPAEDIRPSERGQLEAVLEGLEKDEARGEPDRR
jgi:hypothetical protein